MFELAPGIDNRYGEASGNGEIGSGEGDGKLAGADKCRRMIDPVEGQVDEVRIRRRSSSETAELVPVAAGNGDSAVIEGIVGPATVVVTIFETAPPIENGRPAPRFPVVDCAGTIALNQYTPTSLGSRPENRTVAVRASDSHHRHRDSLCRRANR